MPLAKLRLCHSVQDYGELLIYNAHGISVVRGTYSITDEIIYIHIYIYIYI
jgi:hypothetical protein